MAYEFQKLSEVEVLTEVPDGASVLAEVNGDIKRVPKSEVGGTGGYVVVLTEDNFEYINYQNQCADNYDALYDVLMAGGTVWIDWTELEGFGSPFRQLAVAWELSSSGLWVYTCTDNNILFPNGSHNLPEAPGPS